MKYMLLIRQGSTPTPPSEEWDALSDEEKGAIYGAYKAISETPGVTSGTSDAAAADGHDRPRAGREDADDGRPFAELKEAIGGLPVRRRRARRAPSR